MRNPPMNIRYRRCSICKRQKRKEGRLGLRRSFDFDERYEPAFFYGTELANLPPEEWERFRPVQETLERVRVGDVLFVGDPRVPEGFGFIWSGDRLLVNRHTSAILTGITYD